MEGKRFTTMPSGGIESQHTTQSPIGRTNQPTASPLSKSNMGQTEETPVTKTKTTGMVDAAPINISTPKSFLFEGVIEMITRTRSQPSGCYLRTILSRLRYVDTVCIAL